MIDRKQRIALACAGLAFFSVNTVAKLDKLARNRLYGVGVENWLRRNIILSMRPKYR